MRLLLAMLESKRVFCEQEINFRRTTIQEEKFKK
jgi:hypothetical protein